MYMPAMLLIFTVSLVLFKAEIPLKKSIEKEAKILEESSPVYFT